MITRLPAIFLLVAAVLVGCTPAAPPASPPGAGGAPSAAPLSKSSLVVAHLYSTTQAQIFVAEGQGLFAKHLGGDVKLDRRAYPDGNQIMSAFRNGEIDIAYVGSVPALISFQEKPNFKIVGGTNIGGTVIVVRPDRGIRAVPDLKGKVIAVPGLANFQDVVLRAAILPGAGVAASADRAPDKVQVVTSTPADMLTKLKEGSIDAAIAFEPWPSRILADPTLKAQVLLDWKAVWREGRYPSSTLIASTAMLEQHRDVLKRFLAAHVEANQYLQERPQEAITLIHDQILKMQGAELPVSVIEGGFQRGENTYDPSVAAVMEFAALANQTYPDRLPTVPKAETLFDLSLLNEVLRERGLPPVGQ
ncbi:MAG: ABC transporter substrate-binding protein [Chloroflexi bacterium]|nr:ABC transporter substrate-binding protein [Chloroflexota bacterium]